MPILPFLPFIMEGASAIYNGISNKNANSKSKKYAEQRYNVERRDALADFNSQNTYNSPAEQMKRLKMAGLNPNLVYGNGAATQAAAPIRSSDSKSISTVPHQIPAGSAGSAVSSIYDLKAKKLQTDNLQKQLDVQDAQIESMRVQNGKTLADTDFSRLNYSNSEFDLKMKKYLEQNSLDMAAANLNKTNADITQTQANTTYTLDNNARSALLAANTIAQGVEAIAMSQAKRASIPLERSEIRARIKSLGLDAKLKSLEYDMRKKGLNPSDPYITRQIGRIVDSIGIVPYIEDTNTKISQKFKNLLKHGRFADNDHLNKK